MWDARPWTILTGVLLVGLLLVPPAGASQRVRDLHYPGRAYNDRNYEMAVEGYRDYLSRYDRQADLARFWLAESYRQLGRYGKAYGVYEKMRADGLEYRPGKTLARQADAARKTGRMTDFLSGLSRDQLVRHAALQDFAVEYATGSDSEEVVGKWADYFRGLPPDRRRGSTREFLAEYERVKKRNTVRKQVRSGRLPADWGAFRGLPEDEQRTLLRAGVSRLAQHGEHERLIRFVDGVPEPVPPALLLHRARALRKSGPSDRVVSAYRELFGTTYEARARFVVATLYQKRDRPGRAIDLLGEAEPEDGTDLAARVHFLRGQLLEETGEPRRALAAFQRVRDHIPSGGLADRSRFEEARLRSRVGQHEQVLELVSGLDESEAIAAEGLYALRAHAHLARGNNRAAAREYARAVKRSEGRSRDSYQHDRAVAWLRRGQPKKALDLLGTIDLTTAPRDLRVPVSVTRIRALAEAGRFEELLDTLAGREDLREDEPRAFYYFRGIARVRTGRYGAGRDDLERVLNRYPNSEYAPAARPVYARAVVESMDPASRPSNRKLEEVLSSLGDVEADRVRLIWAGRLEEAGRRARARSRYTRLIESGSDDDLRARALLKLVQMHLDANNPDRAASVLQSVDSSLLSRTPAGQALYLLMKRDYSRGNHDRAARWATIYRDQGFQDNRAFATFVRAERAFAGEDDGRARRLYRAVLDRDPSGLTLESTLYRLGVLAYEFGHLDRAGNYLDRVGVPNSMDADPFHALYGRVLFEQRQYGEARNHLEELGKPGPGEALSLAESLARTGAVDAARARVQSLNVNTSHRRAWTSLVGGLVTLKEGDAEAAEKKLLKTLYRHPDWNGLDRLLHLLVRINRDQGDEAGVQKYSDRLRSEYPDSPWTAELSSGGNNG